MNAPAHCSRCTSPVEAGDLRCAICALPVPVGAVNHKLETISIHRCDGCGAALEYDVHEQAPRCAFCGEKAHVETSTDPIETAQGYLPFLVSPQDAETALRTWLGSQGFFRPSDLSHRATVADLKPIWWAAWVFDTDALVSWTLDANVGGHRSTWAPYSGQDRLDLKGTLVSASRGLTAHEFSLLSNHFDLSTAQARPHEMPGAAIERFDVQRSAARQTVANGVRLIAQAHAKQMAPGSSKRNIRVSVLPRRFVTRRLAFPSYILAYRYEKKVFRTVIHGQRANLVVGKAPLDWMKILLVAAGVAALLVVIFVLFMVFMALIN